MLHERTVTQRPCIHPTPHTQRSTAISTRIFVGNLSFRATEQQLTDTFSTAGQVTRVHIGVDRETGRSRGFAFVEFASPSEAAEAIKRFDGQEVDGRKLRVNSAEDRPRRPDAPGTRFGPPSTARPSYAVSPPPAPDHQWTDAFAVNGFGGAGKPLRGKGSRRGLRGRKRSLNF